MHEDRVIRMRQLLAEANAPITKRPEALTAFLYRDTGAPMRTTLKRRSMIKDLLVTVHDYDLQLYIDAFLAEADRASLSGLETKQLVVLSGWVSGVVDRLSTAADSPESPPAR